MGYDYGSLFNQSFDSGVGLGAAMHEKQNRNAITRIKKKGLEDAKAEADASGAPKYTVDSGASDPAAPDFVYSDKAAADSGTATMNAAASMQAEIDAEMRGRVTGAPQTAAAAPGLGTTPPPANEAAAPAPAQAPGQGTPMTPQQFYAQKQLDTPKRDAMDIYHKKYAPKVVQALIEQGKEAEATKFEDWSRSQQGAAYGKKYMEVLDQVHRGDTAGALAGMQDLYNRQTPDGQYVIVKPSKNKGEFTLETRDEKTNKILGTRTGTSDELTQLGLGMLAPQQRFALDQKTAADAVTKQDALDKEQRGYRHAEEMAKNKPEAVSPLMKAMNDRERMAAANPKDPRLAAMDAYIDKMKTQGGGNSTTINVGLTPREGKDGMVLVNEAGQTIAAPGLEDPRHVATTQAANALAGVSLVTPPPQKDPATGEPIQSPPYLSRNGRKISAANPSTAEEYKSIQAHMETLRKAGKPMPWEKKPPGLKR